MRIASYLIIIFLAPFILFLNFQLLVFSSRFYKSEFDKLNVYSQFASKEEVNTQSANLIRYLCCGKSLEGDFFSQREKLHLADVKNLIRLTSLHFFLIASLVFTCLILLIRTNQSKLIIFALKWGSLVTIMAIFVLWLATFFNFEPVFERLHLISFKNDLWQLPPEASLIKMFPQQFFVDFANRLALQTVVLSVLILIISLLMEKKIVAKSR